MRLNEVKHTSIVKAHEESPAVQHCSIYTIDELHMKDNILPCPPV